MGSWWRNTGHTEHHITLSKLISTTFQPLTTYSSGLYNLKVTVRSSDNPVYITENSDYTEYNLVVLRKLHVHLSCTCTYVHVMHVNTCILYLTYSTALPPSMPTISVTSRHPSPQDGCGQAMVVSCTANLVENLLILPHQPLHGLVPVVMKYLLEEETTLWCLIWQSN